MGASPGQFEPSSRLQPRPRTKRLSSQSSTEPSNAEPTAGLILVGEVIKPLGLKGELLIKATSDNPDRFKAGAKLICLSKQGVRQQRILETANTQGPRITIGFEGIQTREEAEATRGELLFIPVEDLPELDHDVFWPHELIGAEVITPAGDLVGSVVELLQGVDQDLLRVATANGEVLVPMVKEIVKNIDPSRRVVTVDLPEGLA